MATTAISIYNRQLDTYRAQLAEMHAQNQQLAAQTSITQAATLAHLFPAPTGSNDDHLALESAQRLTFDAWLFVTRLDPTRH